MACYLEVEVVGVVLLQNGNRPQPELPHFPLPSLASHHLHRLVHPTQPLLVTSALLEAVPLPPVVLLGILVDAVKLVVVQLELLLVGKVEHLPDGLSPLAICPLHRVLVQNSSDLLEL